MYCFEILLRMQYFSCGNDKYTEIKMCDLEPFSKIRSHLSLITHQKYRGNRAARLKVIRPFMQQCKQCARRISVS